MILNKLRGVFAIFQMAITLSVLIIFMYIFKSRNRHIRRVWGSLEIKLLRATIEIVGQEDPDAQMQIMNHQSVLDIILFEHIHSKDIAWVSKIEIANIPWFGNITKIPNMILVERDSKKSLIKLLKDCKIELDKGRPIVIFPEGTRTNGKRLKKFKGGAKIIANKYNLKVQPVIILGSRAVLDSQNLTQQGGKIKIVYLPAVQANKDTNWYLDIENDMRLCLKNELSLKSSNIES